MEKFNPAWNPWVGGGVPYCFGRQPNAAAVNLVGLSEAFVQMVEHAAKAERREAADIQEAITKVRFGVRDTFVDSFDAAHDDACRRKLGFKSWDEEAQAIWDELFTLMSSKCGDSQDSGIDFTNFFRALTDHEPPRAATTDGEDGKDATMADADDDADADGGAVLGEAAVAKAALRAVLSEAALEEVGGWPEAHRSAWLEWANTYWARVRAEDDAEGRKASMRNANPKYILRNWMAMEAYDAAARGDYAIVQELYGVLSKPYDDQGAEVAARWATTTPQWARGRAGLAFLS